MRVFLTILEGPTPKEAVPILATEDREFVQAVVDRIAKRLLPPEGDDVAHGSIRAEVR